MKKTIPGFVLLFICLGFFSKILFAQEPLDPGDDPMHADSAKYMIPLKTVENSNNHLILNLNILPMLAQE